MFKRLLSLFAFLPFVGFAQKSNGFEGIWINQDSTQKILIYEEENLFFGKLIDLSNGAFHEFDINNNIDSLQNRRVVGITVLSNFELTDSDKLKYGKIYNFKNGNTYNGKIVLKDDHMHLTGYFGVFFFLGKTQHWRKFTP